MLDLENQFAILKAGTCCTVVRPEGHRRYPLSQALIRQYRAGTAMTTPWLVRLASQLPPTEFDPLVFCVTAVNALRLEKRIAIPTLLGEALISCSLLKDFWRFGSDKRVLAHNRQTHCVPGLKSTNHVRRAAESKILESCGREARGIAFGTEHDHMEIMIGRDRQPRAGGGVSWSYQDVTFDNQRARNTALDRALAFGANIDQYRLCHGYTA